MIVVTEATPSEAPDTFNTVGHALLFGFPPAPLEVTIRSRPRAWRVGGATRAMGIAIVIAPVVALVPPHAPWLIGALATGGLFATRRWTERFTLLTVEGCCPKCGSELDIKAGRLRQPHPLPCEGCHHEGRLQLPEGVLAGHGGERS